MGYFAIKLPIILSGSGFEMEGSYAATQKVLEEEFNQDPRPLILLFEMNKKISKSEFEAFIRKTINHVLENHEGKAEPPQYKNHFAYVSISLENDIDIDSFKSQLPKHDDFKVLLTGSTVIEDEMSKGSQTDLKNAEMIGLPIALIVLLIAFGGLVAAAIPIVIGVIAVLSTMGIVYFLGHYLNLSIFVLNVVPMIGLALSIDFALLYINRFREELIKHDVKTAISYTMKTAGRSIAFSGLCVALGLSGMLLIEVDIFQSVAIGGIAVVIVSILSALTFLPAILSVIGHNINKAMILKGNRNEQAKWKSFASFVMKRPIFMTLASLILLTFALLPIKDMELEIPDATALPSDSETRIAYETFEKNFVPSDESNVVIVLKSKEELLNKKSLLKVQDFISRLEEQAIVHHVDSIFSATGVNSEQLLLMMQDPIRKAQLQPVLDSLTTANKTLLYVTIDAPPESDQAKDWVREIEREEMPLSFTVGGYSKFNQEIFDEIFEKVPLGLLLIIGSTYLILLIAFRSVLIPLKAILMNMFSLGAAFGIVVWIFQEGHLGNAPSAIGLMIPVIAFAVVFGLSMDYEVFLISRIQEEYLRTNDNNLATLTGLTITSKIITAAAAIMIVVTRAFAFTEIVPVKQIGIAVALSILIDATIVRMILVPSLMKLLGDWNWWMPFRSKNIRKPGN
ncbi:MMPL family transporter [Niallia endozanthoxylica]|uniref:MMPL family transporter n=2 Tax=Niallia endozanthoxylica TaxID=2036016 RepID=A0A5J5HS51_9BACI|nr:MMPL family transporter [Niallia endozanthoxylica]